MLQVVTIDGPAGSGKSTIASQVAERLGWRVLDTGGMYRGVTLFLLDRGIELGNAEAVETALEDLDLHLDQEGRLHLSGSLVAPDSLRTGLVEKGVSIISAYTFVRNRMRTLQRAAAQTGRLVAEGRDLGSVVFPDATGKFFLDADLECRARRRLADFQAKGRDIDLSGVMEQMAHRDHADTSRSDGALICAPDAHRIDTTGMSPWQVVEAILAHLCPGQGEA